MSKVPGYHAISGNGIEAEGIVTFKADSKGHIGLEIPGLLSINNLEEDVEEVAEATQGDLFLHTANSNVYSKKEEEGE